MVWSIGLPIGGGGKWVRMRFQWMFHTFEHFVLLVYTGSPFSDQMVILCNTFSKVEPWCDTFSSLLGVAEGEGGCVSNECFTLLSILCFSSTRQAHFQTRWSFCVIHSAKLSHGLIHSASYWGWRKVSADVFPMNVSQFWAFCASRLHGKLIFKPDGHFVRYFQQSWARCDTFGFLLRVAEGECGCVSNECFTLLSILCFSSTREAHFQTRWSFRVIHSANLNHGVIHSASY